MSAPDEELHRYGISRQTITEMYDLWRLSNVPKSRLERQFLGVATQHGKLFNRLVKKYLGADVEKRHPLVVENERLRRILYEHGINPFESSESALTQHVDGTIDFDQGGEENCGGE